MTRPAFSRPDVLGSLGKSPVFMAALAHELEAYCKNSKSLCAGSLARALHSDKQRDIEHTVRFLGLLATFVRIFLTGAGKRAPYKGVSPHSMRIFVNHGILYAEDVISAAMDDGDAAEWLPHAIDRLVQTVMAELEPLAGDRKPIGRA